MEPGTTQFGKYQLFEKIASGGIAEIWRALRQGGDHFVVVKRLRPSLAKDPDLQAMFIREAKIAVQLSHGNVPQVFDLGLVNGDFYIELEYLPGSNLRMVLPRCDGPGIVPHDLAALVAAELCDALDHLHRKLGPAGAPLQLVHREVAPDNCVITFDGRVKLIDFSAATGLAPLGASPYLSPEQLHGAPLDRRSDLFSLAVMLYEMLTGRRLYATIATPLAKELHCCRPVLPPRAVNSRIPPDLERIVLTGLEHDRARRYQWASDMGGALRGYLQKLREPPGRATLRDFMHRLFAQEAAAEASRTFDLAQRAPMAHPPPKGSHRERGFDFEIDESLMQDVVPNPEPHTAENDLPDDSARGETVAADLDGPVPTIIVPITLPPEAKAAPVPPPLPPPRAPAPPAASAAPAPAAAPAAAAAPGSKPSTPTLSEAEAAAQRKEQRWRIAIPLRGVWGTEGNLTNHFGASLVNLSTTGAKLRLDENLPIPVGGVVGFTLPLRLHNMIPLEGKVRWSRQGPGGREIGVEFSRPHPELLKLHRVK